MPSGGRINYYKKIKLSLDKCVAVQYLHNKHKANKVKVKASNFEYISFEYTPSSKASLNVKQTLCANAHYYSRENREVVENEVNKLA